MGSICFSMSFLRRAWHHRKKKMWILTGTSTCHGHVSWLIYVNIRYMGHPTIMNGIHHNWYVKPLWIVMTISQYSVNTWKNIEMGRTSIYQPVWGARGFVTYRMQARDWQQGTTYLVSADFLRLIIISLDLAAIGIILPCYEYAKTFLGRTAEWVTQCPVTSLGDMGHATPK